MAKRKSNYVPVPKADPETQQRLHVVMLQMTGQISATEAAELLQISRLHYQTLRNRSLQAMVDALTPGLPGRPSSDPKVRAMKERIADLEEENERLRVQAERNEQLINGLTQTLREVSATTRTPRRTSRKTKTSGGDDEEDHRRKLLERSEELVARGMTLELAALAVRRNAATLRRWRARRQQGLLLARRRGPASGRHACPLARARVAQTVRDTRGLVGADALRRMEPRVSRRQAAAIKATTVRKMEQARIVSATRVRVAIPGAVRGLDQLWVRTAECMHCVLALADGAVPYRTTVARIECYDGDCVAAVVARDFAEHGAPLVLRLDRAKAHQVAAVHAVCEQHRVLVLHGPPHCPMYYGQLERQNREHRAWLDAGEVLHDTHLDDALVEMKRVLNTLWPRRTLSWCTSAAMWTGRPELFVDRDALRDRVTEKASRIARKLPPKAVALGTHHRLAIEQELVALGLLELQPGGWC